MPRWISRWYNFIQNRFFNFDFLIVNPLQRSVISLAPTVLTEHYVHQIREFQVGSYRFGF